MTFNEIRQELINAAEQDFAAFSSKIIPTNYPMLGVRTPTLKKLAKQAEEDYFSCTPKYYEELMVYGFALGNRCKDADMLFKLLPRYLDFVDNWAAIDSPVSAMKSIAKDKEKSFEKIEPYLFEEKEYFARFGCVALFYFMDDDYIERVLSLYEKVKGGRYYVDMAIAWGLSIAAVKHYELVYAALARGAYPEFITRKAVSKCRDSFRIPKERKEELKELLKQRPVSS